MGHTFEPDYLLAVNDLISRRDILAEAPREGMYWGLGRTTTLVAVGSLILLGHVTFLTFCYFKFAVGLMLVVMGFSQLLEQRRPPAKVRRAVCTVGFLHSLAASGALVLLVMSEIRSPWLSVLYLAVFGVASILGIFIVAGLCSVLFTKRLKISRALKFSVVTLSSLLCIGYGEWVIYGNVRR